MNYYSKTVSYLLILILVISCQTNQKEVKERMAINPNILSLKDKNIISINDSTINSGNLNYLCLEAGDIYVYTTEKFNNFYANYFYNLKDSTKNFSIKLLKEGPNAVGKLLLPILAKDTNEFYSLNWESEILTFNRKGKILDKWKIPHADSIERMRVHQFAKLAKENNNFILEYTPVSWDKYYERRLTAQFNLKSKDLSFVDSYYPEFMQEGDDYGVSSWNYSRVSDDQERMIYSFNYDPNLYVYNDKSQKIINALIPECLDAYKEPIGEGAPMDKQLDYFLQRAQYFNLYHDQISGNIARVVYCGVSDEELGEKNAWHDKDFYVQIFNQDFEYLGYKFFEGMKFSASSLLFHDNIIYMPFHNKSNLETVEDKIILYKYEISN